MEEEKQEAQSDTRNSLIEGRKEGARCDAWNVHGEGTACGAAFSMIGKEAVGAERMTKQPNRDIIPPPPPK